MVCNGGDRSIVICKWVGGWWCSASASASASASVREISRGYVTVSDDGE
jgi:hypothetical protein